MNMAFQAIVSEDGPTTLAEQEKILQEVFEAACGRVMRAKAIWNVPGRKTPLRVMRLPNEEAAVLYQSPNTTLMALGFRMANSNKINWVARERNGFIKPMNGLSLEEACEEISLRF